MKIKYIDVKNVSEDVENKINTIITIGKMLGYDIHYQLNLTYHIIMIKLQVEDDVKFVVYLHCDSDYKLIKIKTLNSDNENENNNKSDIELLDDLLKAL